MLTRAFLGSMVVIMIKTPTAEDAPLKPCTCVRCGHKWWPRPNIQANSGGKPLYCARCHSRHWETAKPRKTKLRKATGTPQLFESSSELAVVS